MPHYARKSPRQATKDSQRYPSGWQRYPKRPGNDPIYLYDANVENRKQT